MSRSAVLNRLWTRACRPAARRFERLLGDPGGHQRRRLMELVRANAGTAFGRAHGFSLLAGVEQLRASVPLQRYEDMAPWIARISAGEQRVLTRERVTRLIPTGGSSGGAKLIPWTAGLGREFSAALAPWVVDLQRRHPGTAAGPAYWSVSPAAVLDRAEGALPIGFADDSAYLGRWLRPLVSALFAAPAGLRMVADLASFRYATLRCLLARRDLALVSVWHPSFFSLLLDAAPEWREQLLHDIATGGVSAPGTIPQPVRAGLRPWLAADPRRAAELRAADWSLAHELWPRLSLVSCWGDGPAATACTALTRRLAGIAVQPKGLLATEGVVTIPVDGAAVLAVDSHVYEFIAADGRVCWADELEDGGVYEVAITTAGGLWRYRLGDRVRVVGFAQRTPCLRFLGRGDRVVDLCGEKLDESFVAACLERVVGGAGFAMLAPDPRATAAGYTLFCDGDAAGSRPLLARLEDELVVNPHYRLARHLGQLAPLRLFRVSSGAVDVFLSRRAEGTCLGAVKPASLHPDSGWSRVLPGAYVETEVGA